MYHNNQWRPACNNGWGKGEADVVCRMSGCGVPLDEEEEDFIEVHGSSGLNVSCVGNEDSLLSCRLQESQQECAYATVVCTNAKPIRLANGNNRCSGRVEIYALGEWGTVCDDGWGFDDATVACRQMNCGSPLSAKSNAYFGGGAGRILIDNIACTGNETSLSECSHRGLTVHDCSHSEDAGVICSDSIRLSGDSDRCSGRVEVYRGSKWGKVCNTNWGPREEKLVCFELACGAPNKTYPFPVYREKKGQKNYASNCSENVNSIGNCTFKETTGSCEGVSLSCTGSPFRIVNGTDRCSGRVEVVQQGEWGAVADEGWDILDANVVCRELDCGTALTAKSGASFGQGPGRVWMNRIQCFGNESSAVNCGRSSYGISGMSHNNGAGVVCSGSVRLDNGRGRCSGRVLIYRSGQWSPALNFNWGSTQAAVVCKELNCGDLVTYSGSPSQVQEQRGFKVTCSGTESSLAHCSLVDYVRTSSDNFGDASVVCSDVVKLVGGTSRCVGRVELYDYGEWRPVCGESWDMLDAAVVCRQLNCGMAHKITVSPEYGYGTGQVRNDRFDCRGQESMLPLCQRNSLSNTTCGSTSIAGVTCTDGLTIRLVNGNNRCSGRVEVFTAGEWKTICDRYWTRNKAKVVCELLGCGKTAKVPGSGEFLQGTGSVIEASDSCFTSVASFGRCSTFRTSTCGHDRDAGVVCEGDPDMRLVNGTDQCSGRVEVLYNGLWGTVCDDGWDIKDVDVVCRAKNCGSAQRAKSSAFFGVGQGPIWLDDVNCYGNESSLSHCGRVVFGQTDCGHGEDAGVVCAAHVRLTNGTDRCSGRVELFHDDQWLPAVNFTWGRNEATMVCREMNCGDVVRYSGSSSLAPGQTGYKVSCSSAESSLADCSLVEYLRTSSDNTGDVSVVCSGILKLNGGPNRCAGRVELFENGQWGTTCGDLLSTNLATVVCRHLNCDSVRDIITAPIYGPGTGRPWAEYYDCNGWEFTVSQCGIRPSRTTTCTTNSVASVICTDGATVRLVNGPDQCSGRLNVRNGDVWATVCDAEWSMTKAHMVCELLDCGRAVNVAGTHFLQGTGPVVDATDSCFTNRTSLDKCSVNSFGTSTCGHERDVSVVCAAPLRLVNGPDECSGRVEIFYKSQWGTVCDDEWGTLDAMVVCRQLGCGPLIEIRSGARFGRGSGPIWLDDLMCKGEEKVLTQCRHNGFGKNNCGHDEDAGVVCAGRLQKPTITLSPASQVNWGDKVEITCTITTSHLGGTFMLGKTQDSFQLERSAVNGFATFVFPKVDFGQSGWYFCEYKKEMHNQLINFPQGDFVQLSVNVKLEKPTISLTSTPAVKMTNNDQISVNKGGSLTVSCSVNSVYPGGYFYVTKSNITTAEPKPAFGHGITYMSSFEFPSMDRERQGEYSCVYSVNLSSKAFTSTSKSVQVTVVGTSSAATAVVVTILVLILVVGGLYVLWRKRRWTTDTIVGFTSRFGGVIEQYLGNIDKDRNTQANDQPGFDQDRDGKNPNYEAESVEKVPEDLTGKLCYDNEPLVFT